MSFRRRREKRKNDCVPAPAWPGLPCRSHSFQAAHANGEVLRSRGYAKRHWIGGFREHSFGGCLRDRVKCRALQTLWQSLDLIPDVWFRSRLRRQAFGAGVCCATCGLLRLSI
jgi:hypothetical protein